MKVFSKKIEIASVQDVEIHVGADILGIVGTRGGAPAKIIYVADEAAETSTIKVGMQNEGTSLPPDVDLELLGTVSLGAFTYATFILAPAADADTPRVEVLTAPELAALEAHEAGIDPNGKAEKAALTRALKKKETLGE